MEFLCVSGERILEFLWVSGVNMRQRERVELCERERELNCEREERLELKEREMEN